MELIDRLDAEKDWRRARRKLLYEEVVCSIKGCSVDLLSFDEVKSGLHLTRRRDRGLQEIPVASIRGSVGRFDDFSSEFLPRKTSLRERWQNVDVAMREGKTPPIDVYQVGQAYFVIDGNHRVSIARQLGLPSIEACVIEFPASVELSAEANFEELLVKSEQVAFLERAGSANETAAHTLESTCSGCYQDLVDQIETYRQGREELESRSISFEEAFTAWYEEAYRPAVEAIRQHDLLARFPGRTEADLFVWARQNNQVIEALELGEAPGDSDRSPEHP